MSRKHTIQRAANRAKAEDAKRREEAGKKAKTKDSFQNHAHRMGIGTDNPTSGATYGFNPVTRNRILLEWIYRGSWLGGIAIDTVADDMTRAGIDIKSTLHPSDIEAIHEDATTLAIWPRLAQGIKWSRLYGGAIAVHLVDGQDPKTPLRIDTVGRDQYKGLIILDRWMVQPRLTDLVTDYGPDLGMPKFYDVVADSPALSRQTIHHSRCIRFEGVDLPFWQRMTENLWGLSTLERLYDRMVAFDSATTGAAQLVYRSYLRTLKVKDLKRISAFGDSDESGQFYQYVDMMRRFQTMEGLTLIDAEDEFGETTGASSSFSGLSDVLTQFGQQISGALQIPLVRMFGQSPAGFSSGDTDLRSYYDSILQQQMRSLKVPVTRIYRMLAQSSGRRIPEAFSVAFKPLWQLTPEAKANVAETTARAIGDMEERGLISAATAMKELRQSSDVTGIFSNITEDDIKAAETDLPPEPEKVKVAEVKEGELGPDGEETEEAEEGDDPKLNAKKTKDAAHARQVAHADALEIAKAGAPQISVNVVPPPTAAPVVNVAPAAVTVQPPSIKVDVQKNGAVKFDTDKDGNITGAKLE